MTRRGAGLPFSAETLGRVLQSEVRSIDWSRLLSCRSIPDVGGGWTFGAQRFVGYIKKGQTPPFTLRPPGIRLTGLIAEDLACCFSQQE